ncbi:MAG: dihydroneopterin aldolase [Actinomycetota bacterium]
MTPVRILMSGIRASGRHGASPGEQDHPQELVVDLDVTVEPTGDHLEDTVDYRRLADAVRSAVESESHRLLETIARSVVEAVRREPKVLRVAATVHKPRAAERLGVGDVAVEAVSE